MTIAQPSLLDVDVDVDVGVPPVSEPHPRHEQTRTKTLALIHEGIGYEACSGIQDPRQLSDRCSDICGELLLPLIAVKTLIVMSNRDAEC